MGNDRRTRRAGRRAPLAFTVALTALAVIAGALPWVGNGAKAASKTIIVAPNGSSKGDGSLARPLSLQTAIGSLSPARPGDQILLRGGTYAGTYTSYMSGSPTAPIVVRSYPEEWAVFDNNTSPTPPLSIKGSDTWFRDFEVTKSDPKRVSSQSGAGPTDISRGSNGSYTQGDGIGVSGARTKLINLVVHDAGNGIVTLKGAVDSEIYGCVIYNNGFLSTDRAWGHAIYLHNNAGTKTVTDSVMFNNWAVGLHAYDSQSIAGVVTEGVTSFGNGMPVDTPRANVLFAPGYGSLDRITVKDNVAYHGDARGDNVRLGFPNDTVLRQNGSVEVDGNIVVGGNAGFVLQGWKSAVVRSNTVAIDGNAALAKVLTNTADGSGYTWDANTYVDPRTSTAEYPLAFGRFTLHAENGWAGGWKDFPSWKNDTAYDGSSTYLRSSLSVPKVVVRPNRYESGRAFITVVNQPRAPSVEIDLGAAGLKAGQVFEIRDVQNLTGPAVLRGVYGGERVTVPMNSTQVMQPVGGSPTSLRHTGADFGVFEVRAV